MSGSSQLVSRLIERLILTRCYDYQNGSLQHDSALQQRSHCRLSTKLSEHFAPSARKATRTMTNQQLAGRARLGRRGLPGLYCWCRIAGREELVRLLTHHHCRQLATHAVGDRSLGARLRPIVVLGRHLVTAGRKGPGISNTALRAAEPPCSASWRMLSAPVASNSVSRTPAALPTPGDISNFGLIDANVGQTQASKGKG